MTVSDWYLAALELVGDYGTLSRDQCAALGIHEDTAHDGFYRIPEPKRWLKEGSPPPEEYVRIWTENGRQFALCDGVPVSPERVFGWCCRYPISEDRYERALREIRAPRIGLFRNPAEGMVAPRTWTDGTYRRIEDGTWSAADRWFR